MNPVVSVVPEQKHSQIVIEWCYLCHCYPLDNHLRNAQGCYIENMWCQLAMVHYDLQLVDQSVQTAYRYDRWPCFCCLVPVLVREVYYCPSYYLSSVSTYVLLPACLWGSCLAPSISCCVSRPTNLQISLHRHWVQKPLLRTSDALLHRSHLYSWCVPLLVDRYGLEYRHLPVVLTPEHSRNLCNSLPLSSGTVWCGRNLSSRRKLYDMCSRMWSRLEQFSLYSSIAKWNCIVPVPAQNHALLVMPRLGLWCIALGSPPIALPCFL